MFEGADRNQLTYSCEEEERVAIKKLLLYSNIFALLPDKSESVWGFMEIRAEYSDMNDKLIPDDEKSLKFETINPHIHHVINLYGDEMRKARAVFQKQRDISREKQRDFSQPINKDKTFTYWKIERHVPGAQICFKLETEKF